MPALLNAAKAATDTCANILKDDNRVITAKGYSNG